MFPAFFAPQSFSAEFLQEIRMFPAKATRCAGLPELSNSALKGIPSGLKGVPTTLKGIPFELKTVPFGVKGIPSMPKGVPSMLKGTPSMLKGTPFEAGLPDYEARTDRPEARLAFPVQGTSASGSAHRQRQRGSALWVKALRQSLSAEFLQGT
ncbi:hypothetical protein [Treponema endosymbiont of Eucomonympha sp.]|uniref:hypothetical protein n=1 Tax=Treponema endosymbiont of Eucomonympha sp. TaxID=1580831 RepID=UPI0013969DB5|nr:hypothetical protein [Treponema endosymbiont of Eucomonympha sp.]